MDQMDVTIQKKTVSKRAKSIAMLSVIVCFRDKGEARDRRVDSVDTTS